VTLFQLPRDGFLACDHDGEAHDQPSPGFVRCLRCHIMYPAGTPAAKRFPGIISQGELFFLPWPLDEAGRWLGYRR
jgi:hypothetical protein